MRVVHVLRVDAGLYYGGGEVQAERTREALQELGVDVSVHSHLNDDLGDLVHFFGLFDSHSEIARYCDARKIPYVVSPIFVTPRSQARLRWRSFRQRFIDFRFPKGHHRLLKGAQEIYPLTRFEQTNLTTFFPSLAADKFHSIPNGVEVRFGEASPDLFRKEFGIEGPFVLHAATIESTKNQLGAIRAMKDSATPLILLGRIHDAEYWDACKREMTPSMRHLGTIPHSSDLLPAAYAAASVFCLPSRREILPLSAMEATVAGCQLVLGAKWGGQEIWDGIAQFVDPDDPSAIGVAIEKALTTSTNPQVKADFLRKYRWQAVGELLKSRYEAVTRF